MRGKRTPDTARKPRRDGGGSENLSPHILPAAGAMIGICATLIGLIKIAEGSGGGKSRADEAIGVTMLLFLVSAFTSYLSLRDATSAPFAALLERVADWCFIVGLIGLSVITLLFAFEAI